LSQFSNKCEGDIVVLVVFEAVNAQSCGSVGLQQLQQTFSLSDDFVEDLKNYLKHD